MERGRKGRNRTWSEYPPLALSLCLLACGWIGGLLQLLLFAVACECGVLEFAGPTATYPIHAELCVGGTMGSGSSSLGDQTRVQP